jgi:hypothetical protein
MDIASLVGEPGAGSGGGGAVADDGARKLGSDPRYAEIQAARLGESSKRLEAREDMRWSSDCARGSGGRSGSSDAEVVMVGAAAPDAAAAALEGGLLACGGEEVGFAGDWLGWSDGDETVIPSLAGDGMCDCIIPAADWGIAASSLFFFQREE